VVAALFAALNLIETAQGAPQAVHLVSKAGVAHPQTLGIVLSTLAVLILGLAALGPERVLRWLRRSKLPNSQTLELPFLDRLKLKLDEGQALAWQMHELQPGPTLGPASAWRGEVYKMLLTERPDWAQRFRDKTYEIPETTDQLVFPARSILEEQVECLQELLKQQKSQSLVP
jgi:hypothetical protein